jgi:hypothetical protein
VKPPRLGDGSAGRAPTLYCTLAFVLQQRKNHGKPQSEYTKGPRMTSVKSHPFRRLGHRGQWPRLANCPCRPWLSNQAMRSTLGRIRYLPSCCNRGFPTSAKFESKLTVRALVWSAKSGTPRSSCICLLRTRGHQKQGEDPWIVTLRASGHWARAAYLHAGHAYSIMGRMSCLYSRTPFLTERPLFLFMRGHSIHIH